MFLSKGVQLPKISWIFIRKFLSNPAKGVTENAGLKFDGPNSRAGNDGLENVTDQKMPVGYSI